MAKYPAVDFFPLPEQETIVGHPAVQSRNNNEIVFRIPLESAPKDLSSMAGLVVFAQQPNGDDRAAWQITSAPAVSASRPAPARGIFTFLLFGFLGGFILNLMPCVLPVISLKIFGFVQQAGQSRQKIFRSGIAFTIGIFAWFIALAVLLIALKGAGRDVTWGGFQFTNPYFVLVLSVIVLVFALNLFGVFEISLPQSVTRSLLSTSERKDLLGSFFQGVFATVLATPCTAPFLGTALGFAFTQSAAIILAMFIAIAAGMSAPYLLLSAQPAWLRFLPKPGPWMVHVKQFMGFLLLATLLFLLYVLGAQRGLEGAIWASCFLLVISVACWMKGAFVVPTASAVKRIVVLVLMLLLVIGSGVYFIGDKFQSAKIASADSQIRGDWQPFTPERLQTELEQGRTVFVDFTAAWCLTCKFNEASVLEAQDVREAFQRHGIVKLKADWTNGDPVITKLLQQFGRPGVPLYVLYPAKNEEPIVFPEVLTKGMILDKLETVAARVGDIEMYGYENEVLLMQEITPPGKIDSSSANLSAEANWLVCEKICIPGGATLQLDLPVASTSQPANTDVFARYRRLLPQNLPGPDVARADWSRVGSDLRLKITSETFAKYPAVDFFPLPEQETIVGHPAVQSRNNGEIVFRIPLESAPKNLSSLAGLVVFAKQPNGDDRAAWQITGAPAVRRADRRPCTEFSRFCSLGFSVGSF